VSTVRNVGGQKAPAQPESISINDNQEFPVKDAVSESSQLETSGNSRSSQPHSLSLVYLIGCRECLRQGIKEGHDR
jgi:hypothetical protein